jgi:two-component system, NarL family, nitrate/nitrite response regulator NarL
MARVLIVDDHPFLLEGVAAVLSAGGHAVVGTAADGIAALEAIARLDPEIVILDVTMPEPDGIAVLARLRSAGDQRPVILLTAHVSDSQIANALAAGANGIITKLGGSLELLEGIEIVSRGGRYIPSELLGRALEGARQAAKPSPLAALSPRELEIAQAAGQGMRNRAIAEKMNASESAIKVALHRIYGKIGIENRTELARLVQQQGD